MMLFFFETANIIHVEGMQEAHKLAEKNKETNTRCRIYTEHPKPEKTTQAKASNNEAEVYSHETSIPQPHSRKPNKTRQKASHSSSTVWNTTRREWPKQIIPKTYSHGINN